MQTYKDNDNNYYLKIKFTDIEELNKVKQLIKRLNQKQTDDDWYHHMARAYAYENPDMPYIECYKIVKRYYSQF